MASRPSQPMSRALPPRTADWGWSRASACQSSLQRRPHQSPKTLGGSWAKGLLRTTPVTRPAPMAQAEPQASLKAGPPAEPPWVPARPSSDVAPNRQDDASRPAPLVRPEASGDAGQGRGAAAVGCPDALPSPQTCRPHRRETSVHLGPAPGRAVCRGGKPGIWRPFYLPHLSGPGQDRPLQPQVLPTQAWCL